MGFFKDLVVKTGNTAARSNIALAVRAGSDYMAIGDLKKVVKQVTVINGAVESITSSILDNEGFTGEPVETAFSIIDNLPRYIKEKEAIIAAGEFIKKVNDWIDEDPVMQEVIKIINSK